MDEMKLTLKTNFMRDIVAKIIEKAIYKKTGYKIGIQLDDLDVGVIDGEAHIHVNINMSSEKDEFIKIIKNIGLKD